MLCDKTFMRDNFHFHPHLRFKHSVFFSIVITVRPNYYGERVLFWEHHAWVCGCVRLYILEVDSSKIKAKD